MLDVRSVGSSIPLGMTRGFRDDEYRDAYLFWLEQCDPRDWTKSQMVLLWDENGEVVDEVIVHSWHAVDDVLAEG